jgi:hypothetical protein
MGIFNFIETFFFISLGIAFVLILLLIYHFKQRFNVLEQKCDTMFEIINNVAQELSNQKCAHINSNISHYANYINGTVKVPVQTTHSHVNESECKILVSDDDCDDEDADEDDDDEDCDDDCDEDDEDDEDEDDDEVVSADEKQTISPPENITFETFDQIKIINVDIGNQIEIDETLDNADEQSESEHESENESESESELESSIEEKTIRVEKLESNKDLDDNTESAINEMNKKESSSETYRKMTVHDLKILVISKGLCSDASKLKKTDLLKLLDSIE